MKRRTNIQLGTRLLVILFLMGVGLITAYVISKLLFMFKGGLLTMLTLQDVMAFIVPGLVAGRYMSWDWTGPHRGVR